jgi:hypothetical protein
LLSDRTELGWKGIPERDTKHLGISGAAEFVPEHVHHNYRYTDAYVKSKQRRNVAAANMNEFSKDLSKKELW